MAPSESPDAPVEGATPLRRDTFLAMRRGAALRCPCCGKGRLYRSYLQQVDRCAVCHEELGHIRADDGPAWLTILIVGHLIVATVLAVDGWAGWPLWVSMTIYPLLAMALALGLLPTAKGVFIGAIWASEGRQAASE